MRVIRSSSSLIRYWQNLVYTEAALLAREETRPLAAPVTKLLDEFQTMLALDLESQRKVLQAQARAVAGDEQLDDGIRAVHNDALHAVEQNRESAIFRALFASDLAATVRFALARQLDVAEAIVGALQLSIIPASLKKHTETLAFLIEQGRSILDERADAFRGETEANLTLQGWKEDVNAVRTSVYGTLVVIAAQKRRARAWAENFFLKVRSGSSDDTGLELESDLEVDVDAGTGALPGDVTAA